MESPAEDMCKGLFNLFKISSLNPIPLVLSYKVDSPGCLSTAGALRSKAKRLTLAGDSHRPLNNSDG